MVAAPAADAASSVSGLAPLKVTDLLTRLQCQCENLFEQIVAPANGRLERFDNAGGWERFSLDGANDERALHIRQLLLTLELHCKLEEQALVFHMQTASQLQRQALDLEKSTLRTLHDLADKVRAADCTPSIQLQWLLALEGVTMLHFDNQQHRLQQSAEVSPDVQSMLKRWQRELRATGVLETK